MGRFRLLQPVLVQLTSFKLPHYRRLVVGEAVNQMAGHTTEDMVEYIEEKELKANTQMLEIIGMLF